jgi:predicted 3-demethylubiquinone-9 3-methyltransferase (glyoxalase superfamily)
MSTMQPFLMAQGGKAGKAMNPYVSLFYDGEVLERTRFRAAWQRNLA